jgi:hypothetical protein
VLMGAVGSSDGLHACGSCSAIMERSCPRTTWHSRASTPTAMIERYIHDLNILKHKGDTRKDLGHMQLEF